MNYKLALIWLICNLISIGILAFYSMLEMACVSFNKVRLQYYVSKGFKRAIWLNYLLQNPSRLFGTTLIGVNVALVIGSECSREFLSALNINPDLAPLYQVILVVIFGELAPMFAARHYAEHVAMMGIPLIYASARLMTPFLWCLGVISKLFYWMLGGKEVEPDEYLNQEELQKIIEEQSDEASSTNRKSEEFNAITSNIFALHGKNVKQVMELLKQNSGLPSSATVSQFEIFLKRHDASYVPIYHNDISNIVAIAYARDLIRANETRRVRDYARPPWFVTETLNLMQILKQFRHNKESVAVVINQQGNATGLIHLDDVLEEIFGEYPYIQGQRHSKQKKIILIDKSFSGEMTVNQFNELYDVILDEDSSKTLGELMIDKLGHRPEKGESVNVGAFELTAKEMTLLDIKTISISSRIR